MEPIIKKQVKPRICRNKSWQHRRNLEKEQEAFVSAAPTGHLRQPGRRAESVPNRGGVSMDHNADQPIPTFNEALSAVMSCTAPRRR